MIIFFSDNPLLFPLLWLLIGLGAWSILIRWKRRRMKDGETKVVVSLPLSLIVKAAFFFEIISFAYQRVNFGFFKISPLTWLHLSSTAGAMILLFVGMRDDRRQLAGRIKLLIIALLWLAKYLVAACFTNYRPISFTETIVLGLVAALCGLASIGFPLWDGIDGLFPMLGAFMCLNLGATDTINIWQGSIRWENLWYYSGTLFAGLTGLWLLAFLPWNFPKAKAVLAEAVVLPISFLMSSWTFDIYMQRFERNRLDIEMISDSTIGRNLILIYCTLLIVAVDLLLVILFRYQHHRSPFSAGHDHLHHRLTQSGFSPVKTTLWLALPMTTLVVFLQVFPKLWELLIPLLLIQVISLPIIYGYLFFIAYYKVNPYKSGAVNERGRP